MIYNSSLFFELLAMQDNLQMYVSLEQTPSFANNIC